MKNELEIRQHNALTNARYDYTELQLDLLFFIISRLRKEQKTSLYELPIRELSILTGKKYDLPYLRQATEGMGSRMFEVETDAELIQLWMFQRVKYIKGQGIIEVRLSEDTLPYLFDIQNNFTSYGLAAVLRLSSKYAKRIYQLCSQWKDLGVTKTYDLQDFKKMLGLLDEKGNEKMKQIGQLREKVLEIAKKQINEHTELRIDYKLEKRGRTFKNIVFTVKSQATTEPIPFDLDPATTMTLPGVQQTQIDRAAYNLDELRITNSKHRQAILSSAEHILAVNRFSHDLKTDKIKAKSNPGGLLLTQLGLVAAKAPKPA